VPADQSIISATADYGTSFAAAVEEGALCAVQFHPEKSQETGLTMLHNFVVSVLGS
jgi:glutamine amidotransferase